jgi:hypothetical protein
LTTGDCRLHRLLLPMAPPVHLLLPLLLLLLY